MRKDMNGFYCRHDSCTKKFVNTISRSRHESSCEYRSEDRKKSRPARVLKPSFDETFTAVYSCVDAKVPSKYKDVVFGYPMKKKSSGAHAIIISNLPKVSQAGSEGSDTSNIPNVFSRKKVDEVAERRGAASAEFQSDEQDSGVSGNTSLKTDISKDNVGLLKKVEPFRDKEMEKIVMPSTDSESSYSDSRDSESLNSESLNSEREKEEIHPIAEENVLEEDCIGARLNQNCTNCSKWENELFCASLAATLNRLDWNKQRIAKIRFQEILYDLEHDRTERILR